MRNFYDTSFNCDMSPGIHNETVIVISSDDEFECVYPDFKKRQSNGRKRQRQPKESPIKKRRVCSERKAGPIRPSNNDVHHELYFWELCDAMSQLEAPQMLTRSRSRELSRNGTKETLSDIVPKQEPSELESGKTVRKKSSSCVSKKNSRKLQSNKETQPLLTSPLDLLQCKNLCQKTLEVESCRHSLKTYEKLEQPVDVDDFIDLLKRKHRQSNDSCNSDNFEKSDKNLVSCSTQSGKCRKRNIRSTPQKFKDDFTNQNYFQSRDILPNHDNIALDNNFQNMDNFVNKDILPSRDNFSDENDFDSRRILLKRKPLVIDYDNSNDVSSDDEDNTDLPNLETVKNHLPNEPLQILKSTKNGIKAQLTTRCPQLKQFSESFQNAECTSLAPVLTSAPVKMEKEVGCSMARDTCHLYLEFPPFLSQPSSNSWLKYRYGDCETTGSNWTKVSEFSQLKVSLVENLLDALRIDTQLASSCKSLIQDTVQREPLNEDIHFGGTFYHQVSSLFQKLTNFKSQPTVDLTTKLLKSLSCSRTLGGAYSVHRALKGAACLHPGRISLPFSSEFLFQVLETTLEADENQQHYNNILSLDYMVSCLEMDFLVNFQMTGLRRMRKSKLFELFDSNSAPHSIDKQLSVACQRYDATNCNVIGILPLLQRLLGIADGVLIAADDGVERVASSLISEYEVCEQLHSRAALIESVSFPFHRFAMVRQVLERWRCRSMSRSLSALMFSDVGELLDAYLTDRFLSALVTHEKGWMSVKMAEELVLLLYTLVESYLHTNKDCLMSSYWKKIGLSEEAKDVVDLSALALLPGYVDLLRSFLVHQLSPKAKLSQKTCLLLVKLECLADLHTYQ